MKFDIGKFTVIFEIADNRSLPQSIKGVRMMAAKVDEFIRNNPTRYSGTATKILRIRALREISHLKIGLVESKEWVEKAYSDNGAGRIW